jgi:hypothetical protein
MFLDAYGVVLFATDEAHKMGRSNISCTQSFASWTCRAGRNWFAYCSDCIRNCLKRGYIRA